MVQNYHEDNKYDRWAGTDRIIILLTPAPIKNPCMERHSERQEMPLVGSFGCLELCLYGLLELRVDKSVL